MQPTNHTSEHDLIIIWSKIKKCRITACKSIYTFAHARGRREKEPPDANLMQTHNARIASATREPLDSALHKHSSLEKKHQREQS